jgi:GR25 family glycosyltransferase involved in LPS biosynthesis
MKINSYFDKIVYINSKNRIDRFKNMIKRLAQLKIEAERFEAVLGGRLDHQKLNFGDKPLKSLNHGEIGCFISHTTIYQLARDNKWDKVLILEDDAKFCDNFHSEFEAAIKQVPDDWDMIYLGQWNYDTITNAKTESGKTAALKSKVGEKVWKADRCWLTHAYAVRGKALEFLINNTKVLYSSFDNVLADIQKDLNVYAIHPDIIKQDGTRSSLR